MAKKSFQSSVGSLQQEGDKGRMDKRTKGLRDAAEDYRKAYGLPARYFLSLGRMVEKKNLATLVRAYARYAQGAAVAGRKLKVEGHDVEQLGAGSLEQGARGQRSEVGGQAEAFARDESLATSCWIPALVFVGSGEEEGALREQVQSLGLRVVDRTDAGPKEQGTKELKDEGTKRPKDEETKRRQNQGTEETGTEGARDEGTKGRKDEGTKGLKDEGLQKPRDEIQAENCELKTEHFTQQCGAVFFYGFRQIEENAIFYALAEAFILPSLYEEWGLVVNEAMAAGLPVIVSRTAGCAEDLLPGSEQVTDGDPASRSRQLAVGSVQCGGLATADDSGLTTDNSLEERSNGFVFDPTSADALAEALRRIAELEDRGWEMGRRSRESVERFSCGNFARQALLAAEAAVRKSATD